MLGATILSIPQFNKIMEKIQQLFNQIINDPLIITLGVLCFGFSSAIELCEIGSRFGKFVTFIMGDES